MNQTSNPAALDKLKLRIQALRAKTIANGCTEEEALSAAAKVAELLDRHDLSLSDVDLRASPCERRVFETHRKKRIPLDDCIGALAHFCDCRVWREKNAAGESSYVFFGLGADVEVAHYLAELIDGAVRAELGRFKTSVDYSRFRHQERHLANASFALGMVASIADRLQAIKAGRDQVNESTGRGLVVLKTSVVDAEFDKLDLKLRTQRSTGRMVSMAAYEAGGAAGAGRWPSIPALARRSQGPLPKDADRIGARDDAPMYFGIIAAYPCFARRAKGPCGGGTPKLLIPNALATVHGVAFENSSGPRRNARSSALSRRAQRNRSSRLSMAPLTI
ncbi:hypothetical protein ABIF41_002982 [Bradyrhizobium japonicum]